MAEFVEVMRLEQLPGKGTVTVVSRDIALFNVNGTRRVIGEKSPVKHSKPLNLPCRLNL
jgi:hypothetical protein